LALGMADEAVWGEKERAGRRREGRLTRKRVKKSCLTQSSWSAGALPLFAAGTFCWAKVAEKTAIGGASGQNFIHFCIKLFGLIIKTC
jgi:hypothetical protein